MQWRTLNCSRSVASNMATISSSAMAFSSGSDFRPGSTSALCGFPHNPVQSQNSVHGLPRFMHDLQAAVLNVRTGTRAGTGTMTGTCDNRKNGHGTCDNRKNGHRDL